MSQRLFLVVPLIAVLALGGCVHADFDIHLLPDGSGRVDVDVAYSGSRWPVFFGDPYESFTTRQGLLEITPIGFVAWSEPKVSKEDGWRHYRTSGFFDDVRAVRFPAREDDQWYIALGFAGVPEQGRIDLESQLDTLLARPLELPSPEKAGMDVSIPDAVMNTLRAQIGTLISGLDANLRLIAPGPVLRADGFDTIEDGQAILHVDTERARLAFQQRAAELVDLPALQNTPPRWEWTLPTDAAGMMLEHRRARAKAMAWWQP